jgi:hypothetical protein
MPVISTEGALFAPQWRDPCICGCESRRRERPQDEPERKCQQALNAIARLQLN